ncbi:hypothetical protein RclHR1_12720005 [Rhizophagus clarus]|uniref:Uncharacterized protein n=1 Tax=Rhizophagus clarus TaxID=94130 RepID=A0A2Z6R0D1_9GLOM|nr:hypothetical protein RclHR1_12720005 [Rhizophagus clarus]
MEKYFQSANNSKGKREKSDNIEHSTGDSFKSQKKIQNKKYKKEQNDWNPKWSQTYLWLVRKEDEEGNPPLCIMFAGLNFIESFSCIIECQVIEEINKSTGWSILLDESTTITIDKYLAIISKHIVRNEPVLRYLGMINLEECDVSLITKDIEIFCNTKGISFKALFHIGSDGASVMIGKHNGVVTKLKNKNPFMISIHCIAHRFALIGKDSVSDVPYFKEYESILKRLYSYFSRSYN